MKESKSQLTNRLRREGSWEEASLFKDGEIRRLRSEGMKRAEAQAAAWEAMEERFPPQDVPMDSGEDGASWEEFAAVAPSTPDSFVRDGLWVYERIAVKGVKPSDAPSPGAWSLLQWARRNKSKFFDSILPKVLAAHQKSEEVQATSSEEDEDDLTLLETLFKDSLLTKLPEEVTAVVRSCLQEVKHLTEHEPPPEAIERLGYSLTKLVYESIRTVLQFPDKYRELYDEL